jgi:hypothetical protein
VHSSTIVHGPHHAATLAPARSSRRVRSIARIVTVFGALLIEALLILGFVVLSLGIGAEGQPGVGPDRPPPPPTHAPAPPPDPGPVLALSVDANQRSALLAARGA